MTFASLAFSYVLGGFTFIPLLLALVLIPAWYLLPTVEHDHIAKEANAKNSGNGEELVDLSAVDAKDTEYTRDGAASGTFAVLRSYHFQSALTALNAKTGNAANTNGTVEGAPESAGASVYQSMYRSVFDRNKNASTTSALLKQEEATEDSDLKAKRKNVAASVFYIVLRHGHLMLYDSASQMEVRHVISLAHHSISLSDTEEGEPMMDADLFIKRTAIVLTPRATPDGFLQARSARPKPFYLFSTLCSDKEDFYQALLTTLPIPPTPKRIAPEATIKLQSSLHSSSLTPETRAFNAILGRIFLSLHRTPFLETFIRTKIENKIARVQKPAFIAALTVQSIDLGDAAPIISNPRLRDLNISGDLTVGLDVRYSGGVKVVIAALAKIDLGPRFKTRTIELMLATSVQRVQGHILVRIKPPPSNRIWFTFESMPEMDIKVEPVVSQRQITYTFILRAIEERIRGVIGETLVKPNWDDVPFFDTRMQRVRGGIWESEGEGVEDRVELEGSTLKTSDQLKNIAEKSTSIPALPTDAASSSFEPEHAILPATLRARDQTNDFRQRSGAAHAGAAAMKAATIAAETDPPRPLRSPSFTSPSVPVVALNGTHVAPVRADDASLQPASRRWSARPSQSLSNRRDAAEGLREMRDRDAAREAGDSPYSHSPRGSITRVDDEDIDDNLGDAITGTPSAINLLDKNGFDTNLSYDLGPTAASPNPSGSMRSRRTDTGMSTAASISSSSSLTSNPPGQQRGKAILAATAAATTAARNWSWNVIAKRGSTDLGRGGAGPFRPRAAGPSRSPILAGQPIGRGQPLPPPGQPLPGPKQSARSVSGNLWGTGIGPIGRKPVNKGHSAGGSNDVLAPELPPRPMRSRTVSQEIYGDVPVQISPVTSLADLPGDNITEGNVAAAPVDLFTDNGGHENHDPVRDGEEFGPWRQNSGFDLEADTSTRNPEGARGGSDGNTMDTTDERLIVGSGDRSTLTEPILIAPDDPVRSVRGPPRLPSRRRLDPPGPGALDESSHSTQGDAVATDSRAEGNLDSTDLSVDNATLNDVRGSPATNSPDSFDRSQQQILEMQSGEDAVRGVDESEDDLLLLDDLSTADDVLVPLRHGTGPAEGRQDSHEIDETALSKSLPESLTSEQQPGGSTTDTQRKFVRTEN